MKRSPRIMISAGEASGDRLGAGLARAILARRPEARIVGMGGREMKAEGVHLVQDASEVAVVGLIEVLSHLPAIRRAMKHLETVLERERPDILVPVDFPDFNLRLAARARRHGVPVVYFVSPQVWAWRRGRVRHIGDLVRRVLVLFPFETEFYDRAGVPANFVGHPVVERFGAPRDPEELIRAAGLDPARPVVALLPGSRRSEIDRILPRMLDSAILLGRRRPGVQFLLQLASTLPAELIEGPLRDAGLDEAVIHDRDYPAILTACSAGVVASGTASLEAAVAGLPMVVVYRAHPVTYLIARLMVRVGDVAMPNLVAGRRVVPELVQGEFTPERVAALVEEYLTSEDRVSEVRRDLADVRRRLGGPGAFDRAAEAVIAEIDSDS
jgi:lipid-A-disaccharide synthase